MKLRFYVKNKKKIYTLKSEVADSATREAHYKFVR